MKKIGFVGAGVMGHGMVRNLMAHGFEVTVYTRTKEKAADLLGEGAQWADTPAACAKGSEAVITIVGYPRDVEDVYFGENGLLGAMAPGGYVIDMTTTRPQLSKQIADRALEQGLHALDAPVSGGDTGAKNGTLAIMVGGERADFEACLPLFEALGSNIRYEGPAGFGQHAKIANQIALAGVMAGVAESLTYAKRHGLDLQTLLCTISAGAAGSWQMSNTAPRILARDFAPGFFVKHFIKDLSIAEEESSTVQTTLPVTGQVLAMYQALADRGMGDLGTQALIRYFE